MVKYIFMIIFLIHMGSKTLTVTEDVYLLLKKIKRQNESFSELLQRLALQINGQKLNDYIGAWDIQDSEFNKIQTILKKNKTQFDIKKVDFD